MRIQLRNGSGCQVAMRQEVWGGVWGRGGRGEAGGMGVNG